MYIKHIEGSIFDGLTLFAILEGEIPLSSSGKCTSPSPLYLPSPGHPCLYFHLHRMGDRAPESKIFSLSQQNQPTGKHLQHCTSVLKMMQRDTTYYLSPIMRTVFLKGTAGSYYKLGLIYFPSLILTSHLHTLRKREDFIKVVLCHFFYRPVAFFFP